MVRVGEVSVAAGLAALTVIGLCAWTVHGSDPADAAARTGNSSLSVFGTIHPPLLSYGTDSAEADVPRTPRVHLASLDSTFDSRFGTTDDSSPSSASRSAWPSASFEERFGSPNPSKTIRVRTVAVAPTTTGTVTVPAEPAPSVVAPARAPRLAAAVPLPRPAPRPAGAQMRYRVASLSDTPVSSAYAPADAAAKDADAPKEANPLTDDPAHTAIYDISARTVYLPSGERLEAHSGLGGYMDDVRAVNLRKRGPTPPNVYELKMREAPFHGVQAIRLVPVDGSKMYGRDGILAHPFMLGANGESNGCVSFKDYPAFLKAYQRGEVTRMVVVEQLDDPPGGRTAADWISGTLKKLFGRS